MSRLLTSASRSLFVLKHSVNKLSSPNRLFACAMSSPTRTSSTSVAIVFSGCGVYDGTELTEGVSALVHLSRAGCDITMFAPDKQQMHTIDHTTGNESEGRNVLVESARLARGNITSLEKCDAKDFDAIVFPGGFGAAKNLCDFAVKNEAMTVDDTVSKVINDFVSEKKVLGFSCIAPVIAAKLIPGVKLTVGSDVESEMHPYAGTATAMKKMGATHVVTDYNEAFVDEDKRVVTCAAYMYAGKPHEIDDSIKAMVDEVVKLAEATKSS